MADLAITLSNTLSVLGAGRPTLWGNTGPTTMTWGVDKWGSESEDFIQDVGKVLANTLTLDSDTTLLEADKLLANTLTTSSEVTAVYVTNGPWFTVFPGEVTNADSRVTTTYTADTDPTTTYAEPSHPSTTWSAA